MREIDTGIDFIQPEFLNILFFQQKNLVIFPYVDLKHLHALEIFAMGYNVIDLESTALYNLKEIIEFEANNSYSQNKNFFFIYNLDANKVKEIMAIEGIHCILNTNDHMKSLIDGNNYIFYNKKNNTFLNYDKKASDLSFEQALISTSENETVLLEKIQHIKILATKIFTELNDNPNSYDCIPEILEEYDIKYWEKILDFIRRYFHIEIPILNFSQKKYSSKNKSHTSSPSDDDKFIEEYEFITKINRYIAKEFVQVIHHYRGDKVNPKHLDIQQLYHPQKLYVYLRNHHWKDGIDTTFFKQWIQMEHTGHTLTNQDFADFTTICKKFGIPESVIYKKPQISSTKELKSISKPINRVKPTKNMANRPIPPSKSFPQYKHFILKRLDEIEKMLKKK